MKVPAKSRELAFLHVVELLSPLEPVEPGRCVDVRYTPCTERASRVHALFVVSPEHWTVERVWTEETRTRVLLGSPLARPLVGEELRLRFRNVGSVPRKLEACLTVG